MTWQVEHARTFPRVFEGNGRAMLEPKESLAMPESQCFTC